MLLAAVLLILGAPIGAAGVDPAPTRVPEDEATVVDSIEIDNRDIFDTDDPRFDHFLFRAANWVHLQTRSSVVRREILLRRGEPYSHQLAEETARNLRARIPLYDAWVEVDTLPDGRLLARVVTIDQWTLELGLAPRREGNRNSLDIGLRENNLLGYAQMLDAAYHFEEDEAGNRDDYGRLFFIDNRLFGSSYGLELACSGDPEDSFNRAALSRPYYDLAQSWSWLVDGGGDSGRRDVYRDDSLIGRSLFDGDRARLLLAFRHGPPQRKIRYDLTWRYRKEATTAWAVRGDTPSDTSAVRSAMAVDSLYHEVIAQVGLHTKDFAELRRIDGFGPTEDYLLGLSAVAFAGHARNADSAVYDTYGFGVRHALYGANQLVMVRCEGRLWEHAQRSARRLLSVSARYYWHPNPVFTFASRADYVSDWRAQPTGSLNLGGVRGLRGYDENFRTGEKLTLLSAEIRLIPDFDLLRVIPGVVAFVDAGRTYRRGEHLDLAGLYASAGVGLRLAFVRASAASSLRIDLAYNEQFGWQLSLGSGQFFLSRGNRMLLTTP